MKKWFTLVILVGLVWSSEAQPVRSYDGSKNNPFLPLSGAVGTELTRLTPARYQDGLKTPVQGKNPREISNLMMEQKGAENNELGLSAAVWVFGQFIHSDLAFVPDNVDEPLPIATPAGDLLGPSITFFRAKYAPGSGLTNARKFLNAVSAYLDGSVVYGSDEATAKWLRTFNGGRLKVSEGNLMPFPTLSGEFNDLRDFNAPFMVDMMGAERYMFASANPMANYNPYLMAMQTLFIREHNRLCADLSKKHSGWTDEQLYQQARRIVAGLIQSITFNEWLPAMGVELGAYSGYNPLINPTVSNEFSLAAFKLENTLMSDKILRLDNNGKEISQGHLPMKASLFHPLQLVTGGGVEPLFKGMAAQSQQEFDAKMVDDLRNATFENRSGGLDMAAITIMSGRDRGIGSLNAIRRASGLPAYRTFEEINNNGQVVDLLKKVYPAVDDIDAWVGMVSEKRMPGRLFGETTMHIISSQFINLREGDRYYYEIDPGLSREEISIIAQTRLKDLIRRNTSVTIIQNEVFKAVKPEDIPFAKVQVVERHLDAKIFPNPVESHMITKIYSVSEGYCEVLFFNAVGKEEYRHLQYLHRGVNDFALRVEDRLAPGLYTVRYRMGGTINTAKLLKR